jgi:parallel beta-helix repeat protein
MRISDYGGWPTNSNTYIIIKNIILSCLNGWNNDNFIDDTFWSAYTGITDNIICALYGSGASDTTAYTELWEWRARSSCSPSAMTVMYLTWGTNKIPSHALNNTIYLLASGNYISTGNGYWPYDCSAIIGATGNITLYSTGNITSDISFDGVNMIILDNLRIDGYNNGLWWTHTNNIYGIYSFDSLYTTINNMEIYNHNDDIWGAESYYQIINNSQFYNSIHWLYYVSSANNTIKNSQFYNNTTAGITLETAGFNSISNNQFYNNQYGLEFFGNANNNTINNIQSYNNTEGIYIYDSSSYNTINNSQTYNNTNRGILFEEYAMGNTINNSQSYNNIHGIWIFNYASGSVLNNVEAYNNNYGI